MDKRTHIINTALNTFYQKGIHSVGINEILKLANVAKKTLYNHFVSKEELVCACLELRDQRFNEWLRNQIADCTTPQQVASALFSAIASWIDNKAPELGDFNGCFFINTAAEFPQSDHPIAMLCKAHKESVLQLLFDKLSHTEQLKGQLEKTIQLAQLLMTLKEGMICQARVTHSSNTLLQDPVLLRQLIASSL
ncbi:TetR/AcrR family transcriptional regulator [Pseudoalteromonas arctica]|uniref:TetR/AcrR family transcriptional regulator n=1 Tax=Pseudoalteromonas arctica TaxID=394751 RepID=A0A7Y0HCN7_9GAMM|nr:TetR/AcrR family transcriptional regulator [Pseudoalteromonas arctica]NMM40269.1 TetR/AcrR family transcriptional regulator [Pseudoalteromonas arctica]